MKHEGAKGTKGNEEFAADERDGKDGRSVMLGATGWSPIQIERQRAAERKSLKHEEIHR